MNKKQYLEMVKKNLEVKVESLKEQVRRDSKRLAEAVEKFDIADVTTIIVWIQNNTAEIQSTQREIEIYNKVLAMGIK